jgi:hypothetical protein
MYDAITVLTIQNKLKFDKDGIAYHNGDCNYKHALQVYKRLFSDYNKKYNTDYKNFFFGFSKFEFYGKHEIPAMEHKYIDRALEMIGLYDLGDKICYLMNIPSDICMESDFYNFSDAIYELEHPGSLDIDWDASIYSDRISEKQIIFPYIDMNWISACVTKEGCKFLYN